MSWPAWTALRPVTAPDEAWLVAGGVGLAPFATLAEALRARNAAVKLVLRRPRAAELFYLDLLNEWTLSSCSATEDGSRGDHGLA